MGELENPCAEKTSTSEFLGRLPVNTGGGVTTRRLTLSHDTETKWCGKPVPGRELDLTQRSWARRTKQHLQVALAQHYSFVTRQS